MIPFLVGLTAIGAFAIAMLYVGIWRANRPPQPEPIEHGDGEP